MTRKTWRIFGLVQAGVILAAFAGCVAQDGLVLLGSGALLLPGSLTFWFTHKWFQPGYGFFLWPALMSAGVNLSLFALLSGLLLLAQKRQKRPD